MNLELYGDLHIIDGWRWRRWFRRRGSGRKVELLLELAQPAAVLWLLNVLSLLGFAGELHAVDQPGPCRQRLDIHGDGHGFQVSPHEALLNRGQEGNQRV